MAYKHGTYGELTASKVRNAASTDTVAVYVGTAPVNLIRGFGTAGIINKPIKVSNFGEAQALLGYAKDWDTYTLCEAVAQHFDNSVGNVGPIYLINVLDPSTHKAGSATSASVAFNNGRGEIASEKIILDTISITDKTEGTHYTVSYDFDRGVAIIEAMAGTTLTGSVTVTYYEVLTTGITASTILGSTSAAGVRTGLAAMDLIYPTYNVIPNLVAAPGWSHLPAVYTGMVAASQKINGHWDAFVLADIPLVDSSAVDTIAKAVTWKSTNGYTSERSKVCWPQVKDGAGRIFHLSTVCAATMMRVDADHDGIPYESPSNKQIMAVSQYFGAGATNQGIDQYDANGLNEKGITTAVFWAGQWKLWGPHTAAYIFGTSMDARAVFDNSLRMLMHITNGFQLRNADRIDDPMDLNLRESIINGEQQILDSYAGRGALLGTPTVEFVESENSSSGVASGDFVWHINATPTVPFKSGTARVTYTDEGFKAYFGGED